MENTSLQHDVSSTPLDNDAADDDDLSLYLAHIRHVSVKVVYIIIGTIGIIDNLFVILIFALFIKISDKVPVRLLSDSIFNRYSIQK